MFVQGLAYAVSRTWTIERLTRKYGDVFTMTLPVFGRSVIVADPVLAKQLFTANTDDVGNIQPNLSRVLGSGSVFALDRAEHRRRRKLLTPPFHGKSIKNYERIFEEETLREIGVLARGRGVRDPRADDADHAERHPAGGVRRRRRANSTSCAGSSRRGSRWVRGWPCCRRPRAPTDGCTPWGRLAEYRRQYDAIVDRLIDDVRADPNFETATTCWPCCCAAPTRTARRCRAGTSPTNC